MGLIVLAMLLGILLALLIRQKAPYAAPQRPHPTSPGEPVPPSLCHACTETPGPSGWCPRHRAILAARLGHHAYTVPVVDAVAVAQHPGWRGRSYRFGVGHPSAPNHTWYVARRTALCGAYSTALEALADLDRLNCVPSSSDLTALRRRLAEVERERTEQRHRAEAAEDALTDITAIARGDMIDPWPADEPKPDTVGGRAYAATTDLVRERDASLADLRAAQEVAADLRAALAQSQDDATVLDETRREEVAAALGEVTSLHARLESYRVSLATLVPILVLALAALVGGA